MKFAPSRVKRTSAAFTLAEVLAALLFMAIVIPVALNGLRVASQAAQAGERKNVAARVAERVLNEYSLTGALPDGKAGTISEGPYQYEWALETLPWTEDASTQMATVRVRYSVQGRPCEVTLSTLLNSGTTTL